MFGPHPDDMTELARPVDAVREWAWNVSAPAHVAWLLHDFDIWVANPHYTGPAVPHPEYDDAEDFYFTDDDRPVSYWAGVAVFKVRK